jgi:F0F1-type ATP synthase assembly protein I
MLLWGRLISNLFQTAIGRCIDKNSMDSLQKVRNKAYTAIVLQTVVVLIIALSYLLFRGEKYFLSTLYGGFSWIIPCFYFTYKLFIMRSNNTALHIVKNLYFGELLKLVFSAVLLSLALKFLPIEILPFFSGYIGAVLSFWFLPIMLLLNVF